jgi:hypothetical protein
LSNGGVMRITARWNGSEKIRCVESGVGSRGFSNDVLDIKLADENLNFICQCQLSAIKTAKKLPNLSVILAFFACLCVRMKKRANRL